MSNMSSMLDHDSLDGEGASGTDSLAGEAVPATDTFRHQNTVVDQAVGAEVLEGQGHNSTEPNTLNTIRLL